MYQLSQGEEHPPPLFGQHSGLSFLSQRREKAREALSHYYSSNLLPLPENPKWRFWRFFPLEGYPYQVKDTIHNQFVLQRHLVNFPPLHVYHSLCLFLNAMNVGATKLLRRGFPFAYNLFVHPEGVIDVDVHGLTIDVGIKRAIQTVELLEAVGNKLTAIHFTGRGFHIFFKSEDNLIQNESNPLRRMELYREQRTAFMRPFIDKGLVSKHDFEASVDPKRIIRALGSVNGKSGYVVTKIPLNDLTSFDLSNIQKIGEVALLAQESRKAMKPTSLGKSDKGVGVSCALPTSPKPQLLSGTCLFSRIMGVKNRHTFMCQFPAENREAAIERFYNMIDRYDLPDIYVFDFHTWIFALSLIALETSRLFKILRQERLFSNVQMLNNYRNLFVVTQKPSRLFAPIANCSDATVSRGHVDFLRSIGLKVFPHGKLCGTPSVVVKGGQVMPQDV